MRLMAPATIDLGDPSEFEAACEGLADLVADFEPSVLVGIANGGVRVAETMQQHLAGSPPLLTIKLQRPATEVKQRLQFAAVLSRLPAPVKDGMRWMEVAAREIGVRRNLAARRMATADAAFRTPEERALLNRRARVLVVDDTIDSGRTLAAALDRLTSIEPKLTMRTAVLTSTFRHPPIHPDYCLWHRTLVRFPWSLDR
jgi:hypoxanthine phosphoribosyltransferase